MFLLLGGEESVRPISAVHSFRYCAKKIAFFERDSHLIDIFIIAIVVAMQLIYEFLRDRWPVSSDLERYYFFPDYSSKI